MFSLFIVEEVKALSVAVINLLLFIFNQAFLLVVILFHKQTAFVNLVAFSLSRISVSSENSQIKVICSRLKESNAVLSKADLSKIGVICSRLKESNAVLTKWKPCDFFENPRGVATIDSVMMKARSECTCSTVFKRSADLVKARGAGAS